jgi:hypothetical protein
MNQFFSKCAFFVLALGFSFGISAQTFFTAYAPEIGTTACPASNVDFLAGVYTDLPSGVSFSGFTRNVVTCQSASSHYRSAAFTSTTLANAIAENRYVTWSFSADETVSFTLNEVSIRHERSASGADNGALYYSVDGAPFEQVGQDFAIPEANARTAFVFGTPVSIPANGTITFRWYCWRVATTGAGNVRFKGGSDYATGSGISGTFASTLPGITVSPTSLGLFNQTLGSPSAEQSFVVSGENLTDDIAINPPSGYEISLTSGAGFASSILLSPTDGDIPTATIYIRLNALVEGDYNGVVEVGSVEVGITNITINGVASNTPPPAIVLNPNSLSNFLQFLGAPSDEQVLLVSGTYLTADITLDAPLGFEISLTSGSGFSNQVVLGQVAGNVSETAVYVRLNYDVVGAIFDFITVTTAGIDPISITLSGSVEEPIPPTLGVSPMTMNPFLQNLGFPSATQVLTVGGENLAGDITIVSTGNFFMSTDAAGPFSQSITLVPFAAYVDPTQIYVHLNASAVGVYSGDITVTTVNVAPVVIAMSGETFEPSGSLLYYWHFNTLETPEDVTSIDADYSLVPGVVGSFSYTNPVAGQRDMDAYDTGSLLNAQMGEGSGKAVRVRNPSTDRTLDFYVPTNMASGIHFTYTTQRSNQGAQENIFSYSVDGINFITAGLTPNVILVSTSYVVYSLDFSAIPEANDNPNFRIRMAFNGSTANTTGSSRIDNITLFADTYLGIEQQQGSQVVLFPNPAHQDIQILTDATVSSVTILDLNGRFISQAYTNIISLEHMESGMYLMLIETTQGTFQRTFVKP